MTSLGIYIHIPFCIQKCLYCDFLSFPEGRQQQALYFDALKKEMQSAADECGDYEVVSVFFGGGTPTSVEPQFIAEIMDILKAKYNLSADAEITIECNPGTADFNAINLYHESGINRLSIGLQSAKDEELRRLGRIHNLSQFEECFKNARAAGFDNINVDMMSALPGQSLEDWKSNLEFVCKLDPKPEHISAYSLIIEEGTPFYQIYGDEAEQLEKSGDATNVASENVYLPLPDEETERVMYRLTKAILAENGYHRYEISNYATEGFECLHNKRYWQGGDYIGFGLGAASLMRGERFHNTVDFQKYLKCLISDESVSDDFRPESIREDIEKLDTTARMEEFMFLGLRMICGVSVEEFKKRFDREIDEVYGDVINELVSDGLMIREGDSIRLTDKGLDISNYCMAKFLL
ncbi:radical SAM family heme chaperone HemW [Butyrivibrio sp. AD3002]|uniref:radical SAM family heme chaperone HemW n=1 Tax=Butyrivibrio sp. AD3002 TaxID=1280670 RepID=UPI0003B6D961|nr:radical SAM family heme chaperone HemW [Butyrivibrio sp. AD3002]